MEDYPRVADELVYGAAIPPHEPIVLTEVRASNDALQDVDIATLMAAELGVPTGRVEAFKKGANSTKYVKALNKAQEEYNPAQEQAMAACAKGGNGSVAFPSKGYATSIFANPEENVGKIVGIVLGALAAVGLLVTGFVAVAPQLGLALPFALPQLPF